MKYTITINQKVIVESGLDIDLQDAAILDWMMQFSHSPKINKLFVENRMYYFFSYDKIISDLPILKLKKDTVYRRIKNMCDLGLLVASPDNQSMQRPYYAFTGLLLSLFISDENKISIHNKSEPTETNPYPYGNKSVPPTDENPNYYNINNYSINIEKRYGEKADKPPHTQRIFKKPSIDELTNFFKEKNFEKKLNWSAQKIEEKAEKFFNFYESKGWMVGKNKMKSWEAAVCGQWLTEKFKTNETNRQNNGTVGQTMVFDKL